jgi:sugar lactone lactonase YvrE
MIKKSIFFAALLSCAAFVNGQSSKALTLDVFTSGIEGPATDAQGNLFVVNFEKEGTVGKIANLSSVPSLFLVLPDSSVGNAIRFLNDSIFYIADYVKHRIYKVNKHTKELTIHAHDSLMNQPNDLALSKKGFLYASDPNWMGESGQLWLIDPDGKTTLLEQDMGTTNGIELSPSGQYLYVNETIQRKVWRYEVLADGSITNKTLFFQFKDFGLDGMKCHSSGDLYIARYGKGTVVVISASGILKREIMLQGPKPTNVAFNASQTLLYVTMQKKKRVEVFDMR